MKLTEKAEYVLDEQKIDRKDNHIVIHEHLSHDGYDEMGPKSDIWDLYVMEVTDKDETSIVRIYHREFWYNFFGDIDDYSLVHETTLTNFYTNMDIRSLLHEKILRARRLVN
jgi:hypothetical protein